MRSQCNQRFMGSGLTPATEYADCEDSYSDSVYCNTRINVTFPHDAYVSDVDKLASLSGPVITYRLEELK